MSAWRLALPGRVLANSQKLTAKSCRHGAVAQLGEHLLCKQGVTGSIPVSSTNFFKSSKLRAHSSILGANATTDSVSRFKRMSYWRRILSWQQLNPPRRVTSKQRSEGF